LDPSFLDNPRARYSLALVRKLTESAAELLANPAIGLEIGTFWRATDAHALGYACMASSTLRTAIHRLIRYSAVVNDVLHLSCEEDGDTFRIVCVNPNGIYGFTRINDDARWASIITMARIFGGEKNDPQEVTFCYPEPAEIGEYYGYFRCPVKFNATVSSISFSREVMDAPFSTANRELARSSDQILFELTQSLNKDDLISRLKLFIIDAMPSGAPSELDAAKALFLSVRTLQRNLSEIASSYKMVLNEVRRDLAEQYILDQTVPVTEISYLLGFSDVSSFSRAFKRWTGQSPLDYRRLA
jgi:AraC-like DNA-binding protein